MPASIICPHCQARLRVPESYSNKAGRCPNCNQRLVVSDVDPQTRTAQGVAANPPAVVPAEALGLPPATPPLDPHAAATLSLVPLPSDGTAAFLVEVRSVPGYEILAELGRGGMGVVYKARQTALKRTVALKMILSDDHAGPADLARFRTEAEASARMQHTNIVQIYEVGEQDGRPYFSLEFVEGGSLATRLDGKPWDNHEAAALVEILARAMHYAHERGIVHRDLKPANVLLTTDGVPKVTDFGLAKRLEDGANLTQTGVVLGTPSYMAPEQASGKSRAIGPATDVYALGAVLYELLTGRPPFQAATALDTVLQVLGEEPVPPRQRQAGVDPDLEAICLKCLAKDPPDRYASAATLAEDLRRFLAGDRPVHARPMDEWTAAARWARKRWVTAVFTVLAASLLLLAYLTMAASSVAYKSIENLTVAAGVPGFLSIMAILVRPRRWVVFATGLFLLVSFGLPLVGWMIFGWPTDGPFQSTVPAKRASSILFGIAFLAGGVMLAGLFGGISRAIARWYQGDTLSVFFGGIVGTITAVCCTCCCSTTLTWVAIAPVVHQVPLGEGAQSLSILSAILMWIGSLLGGLLGFCTGAMVVARFGRRRQASR